MSSLTKFGFGIEIEAVVEPWKIRPEWRNKPQEYYERLALALRNRKLRALADRLDSGYRAQHTEHYNKWFITKDGSLQGTGNQVCLEAVSPVLKTGTSDWENELMLFWEAMRKVFKVQENFTCGSHVHVAPPNRSYSLGELKIIAFAIITQERLIQALLPPARQSNVYCKPNTEVSPQLRTHLQNGRNSAAFTAIRNRILAIESKSQVWELMQGAGQDGRYVIWNFKNITGTGTIEFRGGRHLRGPNRTLWWITFAVAFISLALNQNLLKYFPTQSIESMNDMSGQVFSSQMFQLWERIKLEADRLQMGGHLPASWNRMKEIPGS